MGLFSLPFGQAGSRSSEDCEQEEPFIMEERSTPSPDSKAAGLESQPEDAAERSQSVTEIMGMSGMTLFEKKCMLINREIDDMGMGRYQWCLWALCGSYHPSSFTFDPH